MKGTVIALMVAILLGSIVSMIGLYWTIKTIEGLTDENVRLQQAINGLRNEIRGKKEEN